MSKDDIPDIELIESNEEESEDEAQEGECFVATVLQW